MTLRVGVFGAGGRMGSTVCRAVDGDPALELVAAVDPHHAGLDMRQVTGCDRPFQVSADGQAFLDAKVDVVIDFTHLDAARSYLLWLAEHSINAVTGTTGFSDADLQSFRDQFTNSNCVIAPNFAIGAVLMMRFAELAKSAPRRSAARFEFQVDTKVDSARCGRWVPHADPRATACSRVRPAHIDRVELVVK
jgi:4-hydroxy-tetrahydrodipicolinate reductase